MNISDHKIHFAQIITKEDFKNNFDLITYNRAKLINIEDNYGIDINKPTNFIVFDADSVFEAIRNKRKC